MQFNPDQAAAIAQLRGPMLVLAGAGSGKTGVITHKILRLLTVGGYAPSQIAAVTFTNKAAREMRERVARQLASGADRGLLIATFHSLGRQILAHGAGPRELGYKPGFTIFDAADAQGLIRELYRGGLQAEAVQLRISAWKNELLDPARALQQAGDDGERAIAAAYAEYQRHLRAYNAVDFDDLLRLPVELLRGSGAARAHWRERCRHLLVDEYQDTNAAQYELLKLLVQPDANFTVVGDDDQSIYAWRGARPENLARLREDFPALQVIKLERNYRSTNRILGAANKLIAVNPRVYDKKLWSALGEGDRIRVLPCADADDEAHRVVAEIRLQRLRHGAAWDDFAILYRSNPQAQVFETALREQGIPFEVSGGASFFERGEVKDVLAYLRLLVNPDDDRAFLRIINLPRREIGPATLEKLGEYAQRRELRLLPAAGEISYSGVLPERTAEALSQFANWYDGLTRRLGEPPATLVRQVLDEIGYRDWLGSSSRDDAQAMRRWEQVESLLGWIERMRDDRGEPLTTEAAVARISLLDMLERADTEAGAAVQLMTLHAAKGLEFDQVFLVGMEEGLLPHRNSIDANTLEEERRLAYVGVTRARRKLVMTYAKSRARGRTVTEQAPSRFLEELPWDELDWEGTKTLSAEEKREQGRSHLAAMKALLAQRAS